MASIRTRKETGMLFFDFRYKGKRCREYTTLTNSVKNRNRMKMILEKIEAEITLDTFDYRTYFPHSPMADIFDEINLIEHKQEADSPSFKEFAEEWYLENEPAWKESYRQTVKNNIDAHLIPSIGDIVISSITKGDILKFRSTLSKSLFRKGELLSPDRINHIMTTYRQIISEAADRFEFANPWIRIKPLKVPRAEVDPFTLEEVQLILREVRDDFLAYYQVRFFTGMRTGEIDGLKWKYVDFKKRIIVIRETIVNGREETPKCPSSYRYIQMSSPVYKALKTQHELTHTLSDFVFCNTKGHALDHRNITKRVWYPLLRLLNLKPRRPYQTRHTAATLWLAAGENPEWIARQLGHVNTRMLFEVYSRFVPNLTRNDGSAFEQLINKARNNANIDTGDSHDKNNQ